MRKIPLAALAGSALALALCAASAHAGVVTLSVGSPSYIDTAFTDYSALTGSALTYTNGDITTQYHPGGAGTTLDTARLAGTTSFSAVSTQTSFGFPTGYTAFTRAGGGQFSDLNFTAANYIGSSTMSEYIRVLNGSNVLATGSVNLTSTPESILVSGNGNLFTEVDIFGFFQGGSGFPTSSTDFNATKNVGALTSGLDVPPVLAVPEPSTWALMLVGFGGLGFMLRNRRQSRIASA